MWQNIRPESLRRSTGQGPSVQTKRKQINFVGFHGGNRLKKPQQTMRAGRALTQGSAPGNKKRAGFCNSSLVGIGEWMAQGCALCLGGHNICSGDAGTLIGAQFTATEDKFANLAEVLLRQHECCERNIIISI